MWRLVVASLWLLVTAILFVLHWQSPDRPALNLPRSNIPITWIALVLAGYNLMHWFRDRRRVRRQFSESEGTPQREASKQQKQITDPEFVFDDRKGKQHDPPAM